MGIQPNVQPDKRSDARSRTDDFDREYVSTQGGHTAANASTASSTSSSAGEQTAAALSRIDELSELLRKSAQTLHSTAENIENRGLKLMLKVLAQERLYMIDALNRSMGRIPGNAAHEAVNSSAPGNVKQGLKDIQSSMTVQRQGREDLARKQFLPEEEELLAAYSSVLETNVPDALRRELESQRAHIAQFYNRIATVTAADEPVVARVFDTRIEGEAAVARLKTSGLAPEQVDTASINRLARVLGPNVITPPNRKSATMAGALSGGIVGAVVGLALAAFVSLAPQLVGWVTVGPITLLVGATLIGVVFGLVFGLLIGQNQREDDIAVTADSLINGEILVVAYPERSQVPMVEEILQVHHSRELQR